MEIQEINSNKQVYEGTIKTVEEVNKYVSKILNKNQIQEILSQLGVITFLTQAIQDES